MPEIRSAGPGDAPGIKVLLGQLGYDRPVEDIEAHLARLGSGVRESVLVAVDDGTLGLIAVQWTTTLHASAPLARITTLVVCDAARGRGIGRMLVDRAAEVAQQAGCQILEVTTASRRADAQAFYRSLGFAASAVKLQRPLT